MRLLVNTATVLKGGSVQVAKSFVQECRDFSEHEFGIILGPGLSTSFNKSEFPSNFRFFFLNYRPSQKILSLQRSGAALDRIETEFNPDVVFTTSGPSYWRPKAPHVMGFNLPHYIYPDSPYFTELLSLDRRIWWRAKSAIIHHFTKRFADVWVVQTDDVNRRLRKWISTENITTVSNTFGRAFAEAALSEQYNERVRRERSSTFRVLLLSSYYRHKNLEIVNDIVESIRELGVEGIEFVMTLPQSDFHRAIKPENRSLVVNVGPQEPEDCPQLYREVDAVLLPSLLECFSANYVEAMAMSRPILSTDLGFARSICADAALYFDPLDGTDALRKILALKEDPGLYRRLIAAGSRELKRFGTPGERAGSYLQVCVDLAEAKVSRDS